MNKEKKKLSAKEYLGQLAGLDISIAQDLDRLEEMKKDACSIRGIDHSRERVQTSMSGDKLGDKVTRYISFNEYINNEIARFSDAREQMIAEIRGLHDPHYMQLLYKVYVEFKSLKITADEMAMSYQYVRNLHKKALEVFERTYQDLYYLT